MEMNEDILWVLKVIGFLVAGVLISKSAGFSTQTSQTAATYQPQTHYQTIILR
jgi:hypothetical protein